MSESNKRKPRVGSAIATIWIALAFVAALFVIVLVLDSPLNDSEAIRVHSLTAAHVEALALPLALVAIAIIARRTVLDVFARPSSESTPSKSDEAESES